MASGRPWLDHNGGPPGVPGPHQTPSVPTGDPTRHRYGSSLHHVSVVSSVLTRSVPADPALIRSSLGGFPRLLDRFPAPSPGVSTPPRAFPPPMGSGVGDTHHIVVLGGVAIPVHRVIRYLADQLQERVLSHMGSVSGHAGKGRQTLAWTNLDLPPSSHGSRPSSGPFGNPLAEAFGTALAPSPWLFGHMAETLDP